MRKLIAILAALIAGAAIAGAVPATRQTVRYRQSDGSIVSIRLHGDENYHYITSGNQVVSLGKDGMFHPAAKPRFDAEKVMQRRAKMPQNRRSTRSVSRISNPISLGEKHFLVLLIDFNDLQFSVPDAQAAFSAMLNQPGYSENGGTGSVADYYKDNSNGRFIPVYDVYGPVKVGGGFADYGSNDPETDYDVAPDKLLLEACKKLDPEVDFSQYDHDHDGTIDNIFFYFAGHNEAEGASADHIWPHASVAYEPGLFLDGVRPGSYACTSEYRGYNGTSMAGIGTFCHEFGHVLGLPDYYDVDYEDNGSSDNLYEFSLMASGSYNNNGRTPPYLCSVSRWLLGWTEGINMTRTPGNYTLGPVQEDQCLSTPTSVDGEFFIYEVRTGEGWDSAIKVYSNSRPVQGMLIYHVDMSDENKVADGKSASRLWADNELNNYKVHPCYYIVKPTTGYSDYNDMLWPGNSGKTEFEGVEWSGVRTGYTLTGISYSDRRASFGLSLPTSRLLHGVVTDSSQKPLGGVKVSALSETAYTDASGAYSLEFPLDIPEYVDVEFRKEMYRPRDAKVRIVTAEAILDVVMLDYSEVETVNLSKHGGATHTLGFSEAQNWSYTLGVRFTAEELEAYAGKTVKAVNFMLNGSQATRVDVFVDFGNERALTRQAMSFGPPSSTSVDVFDAQVTIPQGKDMIVGVSVKEITERYAIVADDLPSVMGAGLILGKYTTEGSDEWQETGYNFCIDCDLGDKPVPFDAAGLRVIANPEKGKAYPAGTVFKLALEGSGWGEIPTGIAWTLDGTPVSGDSITLSAAGKHTVKALVSYSDGSTEEIEQVILVQ